MTAPKPPFIGLTGAIASGKSAALAALDELGATTLSTDAVTHELLGARATVQRLVERWGPDVRTDGKIDRQKVSEIVFAERDELAWLESILHPLVGERVASWRSALPAATPVAVVDVPLLFEAGMEGIFDGTLVVRAGDERRAAWLSERGDRAAEGRSGRQLSEQDKAGRATWVVMNDGTLDDLKRNLEALWPELVSVRAEP